MTGNLTQELNNVIWEPSVTLKQEFNDLTSFPTSFPETKINSVKYVPFPDKTITNYIVWEFILKGFLTFKAVDQCFLNCEDMSNAKEFIDTLVLDSFDRANEEFNTRKRELRIGFSLPRPKDAILLSYRNKLIEQIESENWTRQNKPL